MLRSEEETENILQHDFTFKISLWSILHLAAVGTRMNNFTWIAYLCKILFIIVTVYKIINVIYPAFYLKSFGLVLKSLSILWLNWSAGYVI